MADPTDDWLDRLWERLALPVCVAIIVIPLLVIPGAFGLIAIVEYLQTGTLPVITLADVTGWPDATTEWVGANQIVNWVLHQWVGASSMALGFLAFWIVMGMGNANASN